MDIIWNKLYIFEGSVKVCVMIMNILLELYLFICFKIVLKIGVKN